MPKSRRFRTAACLHRLLTVGPALTRYMETEQHEALFPVIATCMRFSQAEVDEILAGRDRRISLGTLRLSLR